MSSDLSINITGDESSKVIAFSGDLDESNLNQAKEEIDPVAHDEKVKAIVLDLSDLNFVNSKGIGYLVAIHTHLSKDKRKMAMAGGNQNVLDVISLVGLTQLIPHFNSLDEAKNHVTA